jgi:regulator of RNase E activity RraA
VNPGDIIFGDDDGIVVATTAQLSELIAIAEDIQKKEDLLLKKMAEGVSLLDMLNFDDHYASVSAGKASKLEFTV